MKAELYREMIEEQMNEKKAYVLDEVMTLLNNAIGYMMEQGLTPDEVADYLGTTKDVLGAIDSEDYEELYELAK